MKRIVLLGLLVLSLFAVSATVPSADAWGCPTGVPFCTVGKNAQCDSWCGTPGWGVCQAPGCCSCLG